MKIKLKISYSLLNIYPHLEEEKILKFDEPITVKEVLNIIGVSPLLTPMILIEDKKISVNYKIVKDEEITLIGPLLGG